jgi:hypothetical protein
MRAPAARLRPPLSRLLTVPALAVPGAVAGHLAVTGTLLPWQVAAAGGGLSALLGVLLPGRGRVAATLAVASAALGAQAVVLTTVGGGQGCLPAVGQGAEVGLRLALLRRDAACPAGTFAAGGLTRVGLSVLLTGVLVILGNLLLAVGGGRCIAVAEFALAHVRAVFTHARLILPRPLVLPSQRRVLPSRAVLVPRCTHRVPIALTRRGPPWPVPAS